MAMRGNIVKNFVIVQFVTPGSKRKIKIVDIVPKSWIFVNELNITKCYYPRQELQDVIQLVQGLVEPDTENWENYTVKCLYDAGIRISSFCQE